KGIYNLVFSPSSNDLVLFGAHTWEHPERGEEEWPSSVAKVCEVATGQEHGALAVYPASDTMIEQAAFAPDGKTLALACGKPYNIAAPEQLRLLDARNLKELASQLIPNGGTWAVAFSPDGRTLATGDRGGMVRLWQVADAEGKPVLKEQAAL